MTTSTVTTYQTLQTQGLISINFSLISQNFKTIDTFIKSFSTFQRKLSDIQKIQKAQVQDLSNFKLSTQNTFATINDMLQNRSSSKGSNLAQAQQIKTIKQQFNKLKTFITQNTRQQHQAQQHRDKESQHVKITFQNILKQNKKQLQQKHNRIVNLQEQLRQIKIKYTSKAQLQTNNNKIYQNIKQLQQYSQQTKQIQNMLKQLDVKNMRDNIDKFQQNMSTQFQQIKRKLKLKSDYSDVIKLQQMLLNIINFANENNYKKLADKAQTKKALIFLQKRINKLLQILFGQEQKNNDGLIVTKGWKCISCTKDLGQYQGKLDKYKPWALFPVKDPQIKDRYSGFGAGFQTIVEETISKKGIETTYDDKGRMTTPFNLSSTVTGAGSLLKPSSSQNKLGPNSGRQSSAAKGHHHNNSSISKNNNNTSPTKPLQMQTSYMSNFGRNNTSDIINLKNQYIQKQRGLMAHVKFIIDSGRKQEEQFKNNNNKI